MANLTRLAARASLIVLKHLSTGLAKVGEWLLAALDGLLRLMATGREVTGPINIGNPHEIPVRAPAERVVRPTDAPSKVALDEGLPKATAYFRKLLAELREREDQAAG